MSTATVLLAALGIAVVPAALLHHRLVALRAHVVDAWARTDAQLRCRHELVPALVETARAYLRYEGGTLVAVTEARNVAEACRLEAGDAPARPELGSLAGAEATLSTALGRLHSIMESYPELRADAHLRELVADLESTGNRLDRARRAYADAVTAYERARLRLPTSLVASVAGFAEAAPFDTGPAAHGARVDVSFA